MLSRAQTDEFGSPCGNAENLFLFLTDGKPTVGETTQSGLENVINNRNSQFNINLFTYGMDSDLGGIDSSILEGLACSYNGIYFAIPSTSSSSELLNLMRSYYEYVAEGVTITQPLWTEPYEDAFGLGLVVTASFPAYYT